MKYIYTILVAVIAWLITAIMLGTKSFSARGCKVTKRFTNLCIVVWHGVVFTSMAAVIYVLFFESLHHFWLAVELGNRAATAAALAIVVLVAYGLHCAYRRIFNYSSNASKESAKKEADKNAWICKRCCFRAGPGTTDLDCPVVHRVSDDKCPCSDSYEIVSFELPLRAVRTKDGGKDPFLYITPTHRGVYKKSVNADGAFADQSTIDIDIDSDEEFELKFKEFHGVDWRGDGSNSNESSAASESAETNPSAEEASTDAQEFGLRLLSDEEANLLGEPNHVFERNKSTLELHGFGNNRYVGRIRYKKQNGGYTTKTLAVVDPEKGQALTDLLNSRGKAIIAEILSSGSATSD